MLDIILKIALLLLVVLQMIAMVVIIIVNKKTLKKDNEFYDRLNKEIDESNRQFQQFLNEHNKEEIGNGQTGNKK